MNCVTAYYKKGNLVMKRNLVFHRYLRTWFVPDLLASFPYGLLYNFDKGGEEIFGDPSAPQWNKFDDGTMGSYDIMDDIGSLLKLLRLIRFVRLFRVVKFFKKRKFLNKFEWFFFNDNVTLIIDFIKLFFVVFFVCHIAACIFYMIADIEDDFHPNTWI